MIFIFEMSYFFGFKKVIYFVIIKNVDKFYWVQVDLNVRNLAGCLKFISLQELEKFIKF